MDSEYPKHRYDAVVVGAGVAGGMVAMRLAEAGKSVLILEAGTDEAMDPAKYQGFISTFHAMGPLRGTPNGPYPVNSSALSPNDSKQDP